MARKNKVQLNEFVADDEGQSFTPDPVNGPDSNERPADNVSEHEPTQVIDSKAAYVAGILNILRGLSPEATAAAFSNLMPYNDPGALPHAQTQASTANMATLTPGKDTSGVGSVPMPRLGEGVVTEEELAAMFESSGMSEDFQKKARVVLETVLAESHLRIETSVEEKYQAKFDDAVDKLEEDLRITVNELAEGVEAYLQMVVEKWLASNELAVESGIKVQIGESVLAGLKDLAEAHSITVKAAEIDVVGDLKAQLAEMNTKYNDMANRVVEMTNENAAYRKDEIVQEMSGTLTKVQVEKLKGLVEKYEFKDEASFREQVKVLKETFVAPNSTGKSSVIEQLNEGVHQVEDKDNVDPEVQRIVNAMSKTVRR